MPLVDDWFQQSEQVWESAHQRQEHAAEIRKHFTDQYHTKAPTYHLETWLSIRDIRGLHHNKKLHIKQLNPVSYHLE